MATFDCVDSSIVPHAYGMSGNLNLVFSVNSAHFALCKKWQKYKKSNYK